MAVDTTNAIKKPAPKLSAKDLAGYVKGNADADKQCFGKKTTIRKTQKSKKK